MLVLSALAISVVFLTLLCVGDPKRRRTSGRAFGGHSVGARRLLAAACALPGLGLALFGDAAGFLMWGGGCALSGWLLAIRHQGRTSVPKPARRH
jgi:hypothetical protein